MNNPPMSKVFIYVWMLALMVVAIYIRVHGATEYHYSEDESLIVRIVEAGSLHDTLKYSLYETHPPLLYALLHCWRNISSEPWFVRSFSLLFGIALIPLYYRIGNLLNGQLTGLCCATLVAFSHGAIIQSYVIRHYAMLLFLLSAGFYYYLLWKKEKKDILLFAYTFFFILACFTHFSALFGIAPIALHEAIDRHTHKKKLSNQLQWAAINFFIFICSVSTYFIWTTRGTVISEFYSASVTTLQLAELTLAYPIGSILYILPSLSLIPFLIYALFLPSTRKKRNFLHLARLSAIAFAAGMCLVVTKHYYPSGTRHGIWILPFIIPTAGWMIANVIEEISSSRKIAITILAFACCALYDPTARFAEASEYQMKEDNWKAMSEYLATLDKSSVIVASRDDAVILTSLYPYLNDDAFFARKMATLAPYHNTHILFNPFYRRMSTGDILAKTLEEAKQQNGLKGVNNLVFMKTDWDVFPEPLAPLPHLFTCHTLDRRIVSFPPFTFPALPPETLISDAERKASPAAFMTISKKDWFERVAPPTGKAHGCLIP